MSESSKRQKNQPPQRSVRDIMEALAAPFAEDEVRFKPAVVSGNRAMALAYVDARAIQDRLDEVLGGEGWQDSYKCLEDGSVVCRLRLRLGDEWITKMDVGSQSEQPDGGDRRKAAFSDALKRAAVKFGIGRYLYRLPTLWADYDPVKRRFVQTPKLPLFARPSDDAAHKPEAQARDASPAKEQSAPAKPAKPAKPAQAPAPSPQPVRRPAAKTAVHNLPANGAELQRRLYDYDAKLAAQGVCAPGALVKHVVEAGVKAGYDPDLATWSGQAMLLAADETRTFEAEARAKQAPRRDVA